MWWIYGRLLADAVVISALRFNREVYSAEFTVGLLADAVVISALTRLWRAPEISVIQGDHSDTRPGDLRVWLHEITMTS